MKTPISYYGGKQNMVKNILPLIPPHRIYVEPFFGGGALFFAKELAKVNVINDKNDFVVNFYEVLQTKFEELKTLINSTLNSETQYKKALYIYKNMPKFSQIERAWAFFVCTQLGFSNKIDGSYGYSIGKRECTKIMNKKKLFDRSLKQKIEKCTILNRDALAVIKKFDTKNTFFYIDPPYLSSNQGHYSGWGLEDQQKLLSLLKKVKGKVLLSGYPQDVDLPGWHIKQFTQNLSVSGLENKGKTKKETLVYNYGKDLYLF